MKKKLNNKEKINQTLLQLNKLQSKNKTHISQLRFRKFSEIEEESVGEDEEKAYQWLLYDFGARNQVTKEKLGLAISISPSLPPFSVLLEK